MRGTLYRTNRRSTHCGIIPAYAGNTGVRFGSVALGRDHPRVCGEHFCELPRDWRDTGSSPRMRGTQQLGIGHGKFAGIIPAYAGNTLTLLAAGECSGDHPRVCGEHVVERRSRRGFKGSSPRMRGTRVQMVRRDYLLGIIPAYAGNTFEDFLHLLFLGDHPRVCGEHPMQQLGHERAPGSSPRMRGTRGRRIRHRLQRRIIPAYAGNTRNQRKGQRPSWDHPRVCGEHLFCDAQFVLFPGSSPRMRGTPAIHIIPEILFGIIPAYAGNTIGKVVVNNKGRDHPRVCGEHAALTIILSVAGGSSPRMRGTPVCRPIPHSSRGIIPAYAGNTPHSSGTWRYRRDHPRVCGEHRP